MALFLLLSMTVFAQSIEESLASAQSVGGGGLESVISVTNGLTTCHLANSHAAGLEALPAG